MKSADRAKYISKGLDMSGDGGLGLTAFLLLLIGYMAETFGPSVTSGRLDPAGCAQLIAKHPSAIRVIKDLIEKHYGVELVRKDVEEQHEVYNKIISVVGKRNMSSTLHIILGSSPDKIGMFLERDGFNVLYLSFSREFIQNTTSHSKTIASFDKNIVVPMREALKGLKRAAVIDVTDTGNTFVAFFTLLRRIDPRIADITFPVMLVMYKSVNADMMAFTNNAKVIVVSDRFFLQSKAARCISKLNPNGIPVKLDAFDYARCNAYRLMHLL